MSTTEVSPQQLESHPVVDHTKESTEVPIVNSATETIEATTKSATETATHAATEVASAVEAAVDAATHTATEAATQAATALESATEAVKDELAVTAKAIRRRTIFNPFAKAKKEEVVAVAKEESLPKEESLATAVAAVVADVEEKAADKKKSVFGNFFARSKSAAKLEDIPVVSQTSNEVPAVELNQTTETETETETERAVDDITVSAVEGTSAAVDATVLTTDAEKSGSEDAAAHAETTEQTETPALEVEQFAKRQSFISKFFGKKKETKEEKEDAREVEQTEEGAEGLHKEDAQAAATAVVEAVKDLVVPDEKKEIVRPSSPLGRLTGFLAKIPAKKEKKKSVDTAKEESAVPIIAEGEVATTEESTSPVPAVEEPIHDSVHEFEHEHEQNKEHEVHATAIATA
ncbi:hypothetical protein BDF14DRAFT_1742940 [Spinellus fusiger]|nr:hypothetical protein BDF14DRAFT_1742940 [Spinellus fusiger]